MTWQRLFLTEQTKQKTHNMSFFLLSNVQRRIEEVEQHYYYATLGDKESNPFSLGIAVRFPYGQYLVRTKAPDQEKVKTGQRKRYPNLI